MAHADWSARSALAEISSSVDIGLTSRGPDYLRPQCPQRVASNPPAKSRKLPVRLGGKWSLIDALDCAEQATFDKRSAPKLIGAPLAVSDDLRAHRRYRDWVHPGGFGSWRLRRRASEVVFKATLAFTMATTFPAAV